MVYATDMNNSSNGASGTADMTYYFCLADNKVGNKTPI